MDEEAILFLLFLALLALGLPVLALIFSIIALRRGRRVKDHEERLASLEAKVRLLFLRVRDLTPKAESPPAEPDDEVMELDLEETPAPVPEGPEEAAPPAPAVPAAPRRAPAPPPAAGTVEPERPPSGSPRKPRARIDWERWIGVRGAALLGGIFFALAALLFFKYSVEKGWISPTVRVVMGVLAGLGGLTAAEVMRKRRFAVTANAVSGASIVALYASFWAAHILFKLIGAPIAYGLMILVTGTACLLAVRHSSLVIAVLGLVGGFATPLLLSTGTDRPIGLFGYVLLLDLGLLAVARARRWASLGALSLIGTLLMQFLWIGFRMGPDRLWLGLVVLAVFALLFALGSRITPAEGKRGFPGTQAAAILLPFAFAIYFASRADLGPHLAPTGFLLLLLSAGAGWVARKQALPWLSTAAAVGVVAFVGVYAVRQTLTPALAWETAGVCLLLAVVFHVFVELDRDSGSRAGPAPAGMISALGLMLVLIGAAAVSRLTGPWPWLAAWLLLAALLYRHAGFAGRALLQPAAAGALALGVSFWHMAFGLGPSAPDHTLYLGTLVGVGVLLQAAALLQRGGAVRVMAEHAAGLYAVVVLFLLLPTGLPNRIWPVFLMIGTLLLGLLAALAASRLRHGGWLLAGMVASFLAQAWWTWEHPGLIGPQILLACIALQLLAVAAFLCLPLLFSSLGRDRWAWYAAALAAPLWFWPLKHLWTARFGTGAIGLLPLLLAAMTLGGLYAASRLIPSEVPARRTAQVWLSAVALGLISIAIPLQLDREWITIGWALEGIAVILLWKRLDHPGLKWFGLFLLGAVTVRLVANPAVLAYHPRSDWAIASWLHYSYLLPAACLIGAGAVLRRLEVKRARPRERWLYAKGHPLGAVAGGLAGILVVFVWINLAIAEWFSPGPDLVVSFDRMPARDTATSIAWAAYALTLLGLGMARRSTGLRWVSLLFLFLTIGKVFLHDLGELKDLYRVASLLGLAISLTSVSLLYQKFVFRSAGKGADKEVA